VTRDPLRSRFHVALPSMRRLRVRAWALACAIALAAAPVAAADYVQAPGSGSMLTFATQYDGETFTGSFPGFVTKFSFDPANLASARLDVTIPLAGVKTGNDDRDATLRGIDFFDIAKFAQARYTATEFHDRGAGRYTAVGTLELHGVRRPVNLLFTWMPGKAPVLMGKAEVNRLDFGIGLGDWADTSLIPDFVAVATRVVFAPAP